jgi:hypothetical protein
MFSNSNAGDFPLPTRYVMVAASNMIGCNLSRFCLMIGEEPLDHPLKAVRILQRKLGRKMPPKEVRRNQAICNQNIVEGDKVEYFRHRGCGRLTAICTLAPAVRPASISER